MLQIGNSRIIKYAIQIGFCKSSHIQLCMLCIWDQSCVKVIVYLICRYIYESFLGILWWNLHMSILFLKYVFQRIDLSKGIDLQYICMLYSAKFWQGKSDRLRVLSRKSLTNLRQKFGWVKYWQTFCRIHQGFPPLEFCAIWYYSHKYSDHE